MKMEIAVQASESGTVTRLLHTPGNAIRAGDPLLVLEVK